MPHFAPAPLPSVESIRSRLREIFPEGLSDRNFLVRLAAARTVFAALYVNAIEGEDTWLSPVFVYRMSDTQAALQSDEERQNYTRAVLRGKYQPFSDRWMQDNSREAIRDETLAQGFAPKNALVRRADVITTSSTGRYALQREFARLFLVPEDEFRAAVETWRATHLSADQLARTVILAKRTHTRGTVFVDLPSGGSRALSAGLSSEIAKAVIELFAPKYLERPVVLWLSESRHHVIEQDDALLRSIGLTVTPEAMLPDLILADVASPLRLVFVEVVATDGPITEERKATILAQTDRAGLPRDRVLFVSAFAERNSAPLKRRLSALATGSFAWCMAEPGTLIWISDGQPMPLTSQRI